MRIYYNFLPFFFALLLHLLILYFFLFQLNFFEQKTISAEAENVIQAVAISQISENNIAKSVDIKNKDKAINTDKPNKIIQQTPVKSVSAVIPVKQKAQAKTELLKQAMQKKEIQEKKEKQAQIKRLLQKSLQTDIQKQLLAEKNVITKSDANTQSSKQSLTQAHNNHSTNDQAEIDRYKTLLIQAISQQWHVPENLPINIHCELSVHLAPGGVVLSIKILQSSGNTLLDNSAILAVKKASPLPVPTETGLFDQFRELTLIVKPDGFTT